MNDLMKEINDKDIDELITTSYTINFTKKYKDKLHYSASRKTVKLQPEEAYEIKLLSTYSTLTQREIAKEYNVTQSLVSDIKNGRLWEYINLSSDNPIKFYK